jgi:hypothetical protein
MPNKISLKMSREGNERKKGKKKMREKVEKLLKRHSKKS